MLFTRLPAAGSYTAHLLPGFLLVAAALGLAFVGDLVASATGVQPADAGLASGLINTSQQIGGAVGLAVTTSIAAARTASLLHAGHPAAAALTGGFHDAFAVTGALALAAAAIAAGFVAVPPQPPRRHPRLRRVRPQRARASPTVIGMTTASTPRPAPGSAARGTARARRTIHDEQVRMRELCGGWPAGGPGKPGRDHQHAQPVKEACLYPLARDLAYQRSADAGDHSTTDYLRLVARDVSPEKGPLPCRRKPRSPPLPQPRQPR